MQTDCFYNAGWTADVREVINYLHKEYSAAPLFVVGTSIGANILVEFCLCILAYKRMPIANVDLICPFLNC